MKIHAKASNGFCVSITVGRDHGTKVPPPGGQYVARGTAAHRS